MKYLKPCILTLLVSATLCLSARPAFADFYSACEPTPYRGRVKTVSYAEGPVDPSTGAPLRKPSIRYETRITRDGRTETRVSTDVDDGRHAQLGMFATTIKEYDGAKRMIRETLKLNGFTPFTTTDCQYDAQGRLLKATTQSTNPEFNRALTYAYGPSWRSQQFRTAVASILKTVTLDASGRPVKEVTFDELRSLEMSLTDYRQVPEGTEACSRDAEGKRYCRVSVRDRHGNVTEERSEAGTQTTTYEYDEAGNWIKRVSPGYNPTSNNAVWRQITYW